MSEAPIPVERDSVADQDADDLAALLAKRERAKPNRWTYLLGVGLVLVIGVVAGAWIGRTTAPTSGPSFPAGGFPGFRPGAGGAGGAGFPGAGFPGAGFPGAGFGGPGETGGSATAGSSGGSATSGTVKLIDGQNLYITDASGATVKVKVGATATVTSQSPSTLADIPVGATVTISGSTGPDGTITAQSVTQGLSASASASGSASPSPSISSQGVTK